MIRVLSTNITSPLGLTTEENYQAVKSGHSVLTTYEHWKGVADPFAASMFSDDQLATMAMAGYSRFEAMAIHSVKEALSHTEISAETVGATKTLFILSTTKCNVEELGMEEGEDGNYLHAGETARKIARSLGITTDPIVVCNACISGVSAQLTAQRLIEAGHYDTAIVCGADCVTPFIVAGFQSFKALSPFPCRPFDIERLGLNVGEAAATLVYQKISQEDAEATAWCLEKGCTNNDAYHVSAPSPVGDGTYRAIMHTMDGVKPEDLAMVGVHGTATMFNDQMESKAIQQAQLSEIPLSAIKGYYGHTMGAAGVLETIISLRALEERCIVPTRGYEEIGVSGKITISNEMLTTEKQRFLKIISGFGGCNGALLFAKEKLSCAEATQKEDACATNLETLHRVQLTPTSLIVDGKVYETEETGKALLTNIYKRYIGNYPKFYKMDMLCRLVFVATELLVQQEDAERGEAGPVEGEERAVILFNRTSSIVSDRKHIATIGEDLLPSPSVFLYTLPNIVTGEIAIKHNYKGETSLYILEEKNEKLMKQIIGTSLLQSLTQSVITGWVDCSDENVFEADLSIIKK